MLNLKLSLTVSVAALLAVSCSSLQTQGFRNPSAPDAVAANPILIVAMDDRASIRNSFEAQVVAELQPHQVTAYLGSARFPAGELRGTREQLLQRLAAAKIATVLLTRMTDRSSYVERGGFGRPIAGGDYNWSDLNEARYQLYTSGGGINSDVRLETKLIHVPDGKVLWIGYTDVVLGEDFDPDAMIRQVAHAIVKGLAADKLIP